MQFVIHLSVSRLGRNTQLPVMWGLDFIELWYCYSAMIQGPICIGEIMFPWRCSRALPSALSLQPRNHAHVLSLNAACPEPGLRNWPSPIQPDFIWSVGKHVILCCGVQSCLLDEKGRPRQQRWFLSTWLWGDFTPMGWAGWSRQSHGGRVWWVNSWICSADWTYLGLDRARTVCWKEQYCWSLVGSFPSIPGPVAAGFLLLLLAGVGLFFTSLLQALAIRKAWPQCCLSGGLGCPLLSRWLFCCSALCTLYVGRKNTSTRL